MIEPQIVIVGLPESGKTTFLAALWHVVNAAEIDTALRFGALGQGDRSYLNTITKQWRSARKQERTIVGGPRNVTMHFKDRNNRDVRVIFPDLPGEDFVRIWEARECSETLSNSLEQSAVLMFVHADTIRAPGWVADEVDQSQSLGLPVPEGDPSPWKPADAPTQVQLVDLLQLIRAQVGERSKRRLVVVLSAWDKVANEASDPASYLAEKLPLLSQYLHGNGDNWDWRVYGISAQGGDYDKDGSGAALAEAEHLRNLDQASKRIGVTHGSTVHHDLTEPLAWLFA